MVKKRLKYFFLNRICDPAAIVFDTYLNFTGQCFFVVTVYMRFDNLGLLLLFSFFIDRIKCIVYQIQ